MKPLKPLKPMKFDAWWPAEFGEPSSSGAADGVRYAYFPKNHRLLIERDGKCTIFDTADYQFRGVLQSSSDSSSLSFLTQHGRVDLDSLRKV
jgi:hypothetical protein